MTHATSILLVSASIFAAPTAAAQTGEITSKESAVTFRSATNMVPVTVVVRDGKGHSVGNLGVEDFQLFDSGKPQMISKFSVENLAGERAAAGAPTRVPATSTATDVTTVATPARIPDRYVAYVFDDVSMENQADLVYTRNAAIRQVEATSDPLQRFAVYTTSGTVTQEFTSDKDKLRKALEAIDLGRARAAKGVVPQCPNISYFMAELVDKLPSKELDRVYGLPVNADKLPPRPVNPDVTPDKYIGDGIQRCRSSKTVRQVISERLLMGNWEARLSVDTLQSIVDRLAAMPGQRTLVLVSRGFYVSDDLRDRQRALLDHAIRSRVMIGALDTRGLDSGVNAEDSMAPSPDTAQSVRFYTRVDADAQTNAMEELASGTGGVFAHGNNDMEGGLARIADTPEVVYILGFSPSRLQLDGKYHQLRVSLKPGRGLNVQFRKGYYAPSSSTDPAVRAKQEVEDAFFSREEVNGLPVVLQTQFFQGDNGNATLSAVAKVDVRNMTLRKQDGRNLDNLTIVTGLFDSDGNFVNGVQKVVELRLLDETLKTRLGDGLLVENSFSVRAGKYMVRMVARDSEGELMATQSSVVDIP